MRIGGSSFPTYPPQGTGPATSWPPADARPDNALSGGQAEGDAPGTAGSADPAPQQPVDLGPAAGFPSSAKRNRAADGHSAGKRNDQFGPHNTVPGPASSGQTSKPANEAASSPAPAARNAVLPGTPSPDPVRTGPSRSTKLSPLGTGESLWKKRGPVEELQHVKKKLLELDKSEQDYRKSVQRDADGSVVDMNYQSNMEAFSTKRAALESRASSLEATARGLWQKSFEDPIRVTTQQLELLADGCQKLIELRKRKSDFDAAPAEFQGSGLEYLGKVADIDTAIAIQTARIDQLKDDPDVFHIFTKQEYFDTPGLSESEVLEKISVEIEVYESELQVYRDALAEPPSCLEVEDVERIVSSRVNELTRLIEPRKRVFSDLEARKALGGTPPTGLHIEEATQARDKALAEATRMLGLLGDQ